MSLPSHPTATGPDFDRTDAPAGPDPPAALLPGSRLGDYQIVREVGRGAMGVVYEAVHTALDKRVALKVMPQQVAPGRLDRFLREARIAAGLHHTNIVPVFDVGTADGVPYYAMQYIAGRTLSTAPDTKKQTAQLTITHAGPGDETAAIAPRRLSYRLPPGDAARYAVQVAEGLAYAHARGVVHRDIKPANLILDPDGVVWIADFGLAFRVDDETLTADGAVLGTPRYMAPEQARGDPDVDARADVYSLGMTLYELVTGRPALPGRELVELIRQAEEYVPPAPRTVEPTVPRDLDTIVVKATAKQPADRYPTARALADDLKRFLAGEPIRARRISLAGKTWRWARRNPAVAALVTAVGMLLTVIAGGGLVLAERFKGERDTARAAEARAVEADRERGRELFRATLTAMRARRAAGQQGQRYENIAAVRELTTKLPADLLTTADRGDLRDEAVAALALPDVREVAPPRPSRSVGFHDVDTDRSLDVYISEDPTTGATVVHRWSQPGSEVRLPAPPANITIRTRSISADGRWVAEMWHDTTDRKKSQFHIWDWRTRRHAVNETLDVGARPPTFHPTRDQVTVYVNRIAVYVFDLNTGGCVARSPARFRPSYLQYSPDGRLLAVVNDGLSSEVVDSETWQTVGVIDCPLALLATWHPNGRELVVGNRVGQVYAWNRETGTGRFLESPHLGSIASLHYSAGGRYLVSSADDQRSFVRDPVRGTPLLTVQGTVIRFAADGRRLNVLGDGSLLSYELTATDEGTLKEHPGWADHVEFDPLGRWLLVAGLAGVALCPVETLLPVYNLQMDPHGSPTFRPDGGELVTYGLFSHAHRWPVTAAADGTVRIGPPTRAMKSTNALAAAGIAEAPQHEGRHVAWSADGRTVAWADDRHERLFVADATPAPARALTGIKPIRVALSPDGALVAASVRGRGVRILGTADWRPVQDFPGYTSAAFSPDGRWLVTGSAREFGFWRTDTWQSERVIRCEETSVTDPSIAFRADGRLVALPVSKRKILLVQPDTGATVVTLTNPEPLTVLALSFHPSGDRLAAARIGHNAVVWNLAGVHRQLAELGLEWDATVAPFGSARPASPPVQIDRGPKLPEPHLWYKKWMRLAAGEEMIRRYADAIDNMNAALGLLPPAATAERAEVLAVRGRYQLANNAPTAALADWRQALELAPDLTEPAKGLARLMVLGPPDCRDPTHGLERATANVHRDPDNKVNRLVLGAAYRLNGRHRDALTELAKVPVESRGPLDGYLRAICRHHLGESTEATAELTAAMAAHDRAEPNRSLYAADELRRLRAEAERIVRPGGSGR